MYSAFRMLCGYLLVWDQCQSLQVLLETLAKHWPVFGLFGLVVVSFMSFFGLLVVWAGLGRGNWFVRAAITLGCVSLLLLIPAYELMIVYVLQVVITFAVLTLWRCGHLSSCGAASEPTRARWQFSIRDLMLLTVLAAWISAMVTQVPAEARTSQVALLIEGVAMALLSVAAAWIAFGRSRWWLRLPCLILLFPSALMAAWLGAWRGVHARRGPWRVRGSWASLLLVSLVLLVPTVAVFWQLNHHPAISNVVELASNTYNDLVAAAKPIEAVDVPFFEDTTQAELKTYVAQCSNVHAKVREALARPRQVPTRERLGKKSAHQCFDDEHRFQAMAAALYGEGKLATMERRNTDAIATFLDLMRLGQALEQDGEMIDWFSGLQIEQMGHHGLANARKSFSVKECRAILTTLIEMSAKPSTPEERAAIRAVLEDNTYGWRFRLMNLLTGIAGEDKV
jgi:hypothetical protein